MSGIVKRGYFLKLAIIVSIYLAVCSIAYRLRHPEKAETQILLDYRNLLTFN